MPVGPTANNEGGTPVTAVRQPYVRQAARQDFDLVLSDLPSWVHVEYRYWFPIWFDTRRALAGAREVKALGERYLPGLDGMDDAEYQAFLDKAVFYNFTARTVSALTGAIFRRQPLVEGLSAGDDADLQDVGLDGEDFDVLASTSGEEINSIGRVGVLVDLAQEVTTTPRPYFSFYQAEHILHWERARDPATGRMRPVRFVLRENAPPPATTDSPTSPKVQAQYRELILVNGLYEQRLYRSPDPDTPTELKAEHRTATIYPLRRGAQLTFIPFHVFGSFRGGLPVEKPPMQDIVDLNFAHYRNYAYLAHGRFFAGFPQFYTEGGQGGPVSAMRLGSGEVWHVEPGGKAGIIELNGQGLIFLERALDIIEQQASSLGGRMMGIRTQAVSESDNQLKLSERNEQSMLLKSARSLDRGWTILLRWWAYWRGSSIDEVKRIEVTFNKDFLFDAGGAREFRAIHSMYKDGLITIDIVYEYLKKNNVVPDWMRLEEFKKNFTRLTSFPMQPDAAARKRGYQTREQELKYADAEAAREHEIELQDDLLEHEDDQNELDRETTEKTAAKAAAAAARSGGPGKPGTPVPTRGGRPGA